MAIIVDLKNTRIGRLLAITKTDKRTKSGSVIWECLCDCGVTCFKRSDSLRAGAVRSCGCLRKDTNVWVKNRLPGTEAGRNKAYRTCKKNASNRALAFELSLEDFEKLTKQDCHYCGIEPRQKLINYTYNGIDRVNNALGYLLSNCVACCGRCNRAKDNMTVEEWRSWLRRIAARNGD